nr:copper resistance protein CopC [Paenibacillus sp. MSJ-34]
MRNDICHTCSFPKRSTLWLLAVLGIFIFSLCLRPVAAQAHAVIERMVPDANERLQEAPPAIELQFNERIEADVASLTLLDSNGKPAAAAEPEPSEDRKTLRLSLPALEDGVYTVSYRVISADGHPVSGAYVFTVGEPDKRIDATTFVPGGQTGHAGHGGHGHGESDGALTLEQFLFYASRVFYYALLLAVAGTALWHALRRGGTEAWTRLLRQAGKYMLPLHLAALVVYIYFQGSSLLAGQPIGDWLKLFLSTKIGLSWLASFALGLAGFAVWMRGRWLTALWAVLLLGAKCWSGHSAAFEQPAYTMALNGVHLLAASIWAGGLMLLFALWRTRSEPLQPFAQQFSNAAVWSMIALTVTGVLSTFAFLPDLSYLLLTAWGKFLIVKTALVLLVIATGYLLRRRVRRGNPVSGLLLRIDAAWLSAIVLIAAIFTYFSPLPANETLLWHEMGDELHTTIKITPNAPGDNRFIAKVWLPEQSGTPKRVTFRLKPLDRPEAGAIDVPLAPYEDRELDEFEGFVKYSYDSKGPYMAFPGRWQVELRIMDADDNEYVKRKEFRIY